MPHTIRPNKVRFTREEVDVFRKSWPGCNLESRSYWFEFASNGDLIDTDVPEHSDGTAALALSQDAQRYWEDNRDEKPSDPTIAAFKVHKDYRA